MDNLAKIFKVLGDPNRLKIFNLLMTGTHCNCELSGKTGMANNLISHHLKILSEANLITADRNEEDGRWIYYSINLTEVENLKSITQDLFNPQRCQPRQPLCPPCKSKTSKEKNDE